MLTAFTKKLTLTILILMVNVAHAGVNPADKYKLQGQVIAIDKVKRLLTIETSTKKLEINTKTYELAIGVKLENMPKSLQYSGVAKLPIGSLVYFDLKSGTEKNKIPTIAKMRVDLQ